MELKDQLRLQRKKAGMSIEQLASASGVPLSTLKKISAGITKDPQVETLRAIADALGCTLNDFVGTVEGLTIDQSTTVLNHDAAQELLRIILTEPEFAMIRAWQSADDRAREDALLLLQKHPRR